MVKFDARMQRVGFNVVQLQIPNTYVHSHVHALKCVMSYHEFIIVEVKITYSIAIKSVEISGLIDVVMISKWQEINCILIRRFISR